MLKDSWYQCELFDVEGEEYEILRCLSGRRSFHHISKKISRFMFCAKILKVQIVKHSEFEIACQVLESYHPS